MSQTSHMGHDLTAETTPTPRAARWSGWPTGSWMHDKPLARPMPGGVRVLLAHAVGSRPRPARRPHQLFSEG
jgi:hypothetical protein